MLLETAPSLATILAASTLAFVPCAAEILKLSAPPTVPVGASKEAQHDFASFSLPAHWFADYTGNDTTPNLFSRDIVNLLYEKTGAHPRIRVGGTSADRTVFNASQKASIIVSETADNGIPLKVSVGPTYYEGFNNFPGSRWTFQVNLANNGSNRVLNAIAEARHVLAKVGSNLDAFEIGNEPDLYPGAVRPANYTVQDYVAEWIPMANELSSHVLKNNPYGLDERRLFQACVYTGRNNSGFSVEAAINDGIDASGHVKSVSLHNYAAGNQAWMRLQNSFMNHTAIAANLSQFVQDIDFLQGYDPSIPLVLGETNSDYVNLNMAQYEGVFGSALWLADYLLYGMSFNITRMNLIQGTTFGYAGWVAVEYEGQAPHVRPPLYGQIFAADVIGTHPNVQVKELEQSSWNLSAYAVYEAEKLAKYVVINLDEWNTTTPYQRPSKKVSLEVPQGVEIATLSALTGPGASADTDISWGGLSWNYTDGRLSRKGKGTVQKLKAKEGKVHFSINSTEAVLVSL